MKAGEIAQLIMCTLYNRDDLNVTPRIYIMPVPIQSEPALTSVPEDSNACSHIDAGKHLYK